MCVCNKIRRIVYTNQDAGISRRKQRPSSTTLTVGISAVRQLDEADHSRNSEVYGPPRVVCRFRPRTAVLEHLVVGPSTAVVSQAGGVSPERVRVVTYLERRPAQRHFVQ